MAQQRLMTAFSLNHRLPCGRLIMLNAIEPEGGDAFKPRQPPSVPQFCYWNDSQMWQGPLTVKEKAFSI